MLPMTIIINDEVLIPYQGELLPLRESDIPAFAALAPIVEIHEDNRLTVDFSGKLSVNNDYLKDWKARKYLVLNV